MTTTQDEFFQTHAPDGVLTPQQAAEFLELTMGDTGTTPDNGGAPDTTPAEVKTTEAVQVAADAAPQPVAEPDPTKAVVLARDGVHTIPYEKLTEAREDSKHWKAQAEAAQAQLAQLQADAQARADAGVAPTRTDNMAAVADAAIEAGADASLFGDFSEEALTKGIQKLIDQRVTQATERMLGEVAKVVQPLEAQKAQSEAQAHWSAIFTKHPDAESIGESAELKSWIDSQPSFARAGYEAVLQQGSASEVIELLDNFKAATGKTQAAAPDPKAAAKALIADAQAAVPASLSDIPGGHAGAGSRAEAMSKMSVIELAETMQDMTPAQRQAYLNRQM